MSREPHSRWMKYAITSLIGGLMAWFTISNYGYAEAASSAEKYRILSDAFSIPGVIFIMVAFLVMVSNGGFFHGISYAMSYAVRTLIPGMMHKNMERYGDYVEKRKDKRLSYGFLFVVGASFLLAAIVFLILFYCS